MQRANMQPFIATQFADLLENNQLNTFAQLWVKQIDWFEEPNQCRGGWSGVGRLQLANKTGEPQVFFLKKQQNFTRRTFKNTVLGEPTFRREFERLQFLNTHGVKVPVVVFYSEGLVGNQQCAILLTAELVGYVDLTTICSDWIPKATNAQKRILIQHVAFAIKEFHGLGLVHRAMYPKHIFVKNQSTNPEIAFIDLEKSRFVKFFKDQVVYDLAALYKRLATISATKKLFFLQHYLASQSLNDAQKKLARAVLKRAEK